MLNGMLLFLVLCVMSTSASPVDLRIPLSKNHLGWHVANLSIPSIGLNNFQAVLTVGGATQIGSLPYAVTRRWSEFDIEIHGQEIYRYSGRVQANELESSFLSLGPREALTASVGSVAVLQAQNRSAELVLGSTSRFFNSTCFENSIMRFPYGLDPDLHLHFNTGGDFNVVASVNLWFMQAVVLPRVPLSVINTIHRSLVDLGKTPDPSSELPMTIFNNCTSSIIPDLPVFTVTLQRGSTELGSIALYPESYINFDTDGNCRIIVRETGARSLNLPFNPLALPNTNLRISSDGFYELCDSAV